MFLTEAAGGPNVEANPAYNDFFARFDASGATKSPLVQFIGLEVHFYVMAWIFDFVAYSARGGDTSGAKPIAVLAGYYQQALGGMLTNNPVWKGVVGTVPDVLFLPYFQLLQVLWLNLLELFHYIQLMMLQRLGCFRL